MQKVIVVGGGIAGISAAAAIAEFASVILLEQESQLGYHASGRSAALFSETYGNATVRALSVASRPALEAGGYFEHLRGALHLGGLADQDKIDALYPALNQLLASVRKLSPAEVHALVPAIAAATTCGGVFEPDAMDIDTNKMLQDNAALLKARGGQVHIGEEVLAIKKAVSGLQVETAKAAYDADVVINASGAWVDVIAERAGLAGLGLQPKRRTAFMFDAGQHDARSWPLVVDINEEFYFKPDAGRLIGSLADETDSAACDAYPDDLDVAIAVDRIEQATDLQIGRPGSPWAGLRTFSADRTPVVGFDPRLPGFFWLAGQGGYGFQVSLTLARIAANLVQGKDMPEDVQSLGVALAALSPQRFL